jgi:hypothetical protein
MPNQFPYDVYSLDSYSLSYHALAQYKQILTRENMPAEIVDIIEDVIIPALENIVASDY